MTKFVFYDLEIAKLIPPRDGTLMEGYDFCEGWSDFPNMGIAVAAWYCSWLDDGHQIGYWADGYDFPLQDMFVSLCDDAIVVGFNSINFDDKLMAANGMQVSTRYDLLQEIRLAAYGSPDWEDQPKGYRYSLDAIARANGMAKTGSGELAPKLWQDGQHQSVIDYCKNDVKVSVELLKLGQAGNLVDPNTGKALQLRLLEDVVNG